MEKYELRQYMKLFAQHYINCNSKEGQQRLEALKKEGRQSFSYPFCREYPCMCDQVEQNKQMHFYHIVLRPDEIRLARAVVIKHLFQYKKNGFRELLKMKNPKYEFDPTTSAVRQTLREEKHEIKAQRVQDVGDVNGIKLQFKIQLNKLELQLNANTVLPDDRLKSVMEAEQSISVPVTPTSPVQQKNSKFFQQEYQTVSLPKIIGTPTDCRSVILFKLDDLNFGLNLRFNDQLTCEAQIDTFEVLNLFSQSRYNVIIRKVPKSPYDLTKSIVDGYDVPLSGKDNLQVDMKFSRVSANQLALSLQVNPVTFVLTPDLYDVLKFAYEQSMLVVQQNEKQSMILQQLLK